MCRPGALCLAIAFLGWVFPLRVSSGPQGGHGTLRRLRGLHLRGCEFFRNTHGRTPPLLKDSGL